MKTKQHTETFRGGPFDGHPVSEGDDEYPVHTFDVGERIAVYHCTEEGFRFVRIRDRIQEDDECS